MNKDDLNLENIELNDRLEHAEGEITILRNLLANLMQDSTSFLEATRERFKSSSLSIPDALDAYNKAGGLLVKTINKVHLELDYD